jgi:hypothetical protein
LKSETRDHLLYLLIALAVVGLALIIGLYDAGHNLKSDDQMQWIAAGVFTCFVFGFVIKNNVTLWRSTKPLAMLISMFIGHLILLSWIVHTVLANAQGKLPLVYYMVVSILEIGVFNYVFERSSKRNGPARKG